MREISYSQAGQDVFVLSQFPEGHKGFFLDIGCSYPQIINNTYLLEQLGWNGVSVDIVDYKEEWSQRNTGFVCANALTLDYASLHLPNVVDYLSIDIDSYPGACYDVLKRVLSCGIEFKVITIEHNSFYIDAEKEKFPQRRMLIEHGYRLVIPDVANQGYIYEDWWNNPKYINDITD